MRLPRDYRPPIQDGPVASSHSTEVDSVAMIVGACDNPIRLGPAAVGDNKIVIDLVVKVLVNEPINDDAIAGTV